MKDINNMSLNDFNNVFKYISRKNKERKGEIVPLKESNKNMIKRRKERNKNGSTNKN